ncbi:putative ATP-dependent RNA helicase ucp12, partial [Tilletia horrida]
MAPRKSNASVKSSGSTSKKAAPLPDWVKNGGKPPPTSTEPITTTFTRRDGTVVTQTHLFPPNTKTPINLLHERITKTTDWAKPDLRPHPLPGSSKSEFTCTIILTKPNKTDASKPHRIEIKPPMRAGQGGALDGLFFSCDSSEKAKHWGATFALFRLYSNQQFGRMLPTLKSSPGGGPREYWQQMENWLKSTEAKSWLSRPENADYLAPDPFEALAKRERQQKERQVKEAARASEIEKGLADPLLSDNGKSGPRISKAWAEAREVRMAPALRELVERTIRGAMQVFGNMIEENGDEVDGADGTQGRDQQAKQSITFEADVITKALSSQGFRPAYVRTAIDWLRSASNLLSKDGSDAASSLRDPLIASLRSKTLSPLEATIQYLLLYVPEEDLPMRFRPSKASDGFVSTAIAANETTSVSDGDNLAWRWTEAALVKEYKWPRKPTANAVQTIREWRQQLLADESRLTSTSSLKDMSASSRLAMVVDVLLAQLGEERADLIDSVQQVLEHAASAADATKQDWEEIQSRRADERIAIEAVLGEERLRPVEGAPDAFDIALAAFPGSEHSLPKHAQKEDLWLRILPHRLSLYPSERRPKSFPTFTVISRTLPSYLCLALTKRLVKVLTTKPDFTDILEAGQGGAILSMVEELDAGWWDVLEQPPTLDSVMAGLIAQQAPKKPSGDGENGQDSIKRSPKKGNSGPQRLAKPLRKEQKIDEELWAQHQQLLERSDHQEMLRVRRSLPAFASRNEILSYLSSSSALSDPSCEFAGRVLIVAGETGCGKSTQVPQFILEDAIDRKEGSLCNIVVTQPRRVSAMGLAARVAAERGEEWVDEDARGDERGNIVGYAIRGERRASRQTRLLFTTTGVLLRRLSSGTDPDLQSISHVVVDEVHERSLDSDFLLLELRELLRRNRTIKLILMSATIEQELFVKYFGNAPCLEIPGRTYP